MTRGHIVNEDAQFVIDALLYWEPVQFFDHMIRWLKLVYTRKVTRKKVAYEIGNRNIIELFFQR